MPSTTPLVFAEKTYPDNYPDDAIEILKAMSFGKGMTLLGSMSLRSQQYAGDYDGYEIVEADSIRGLRERFQDIIKRLRAMPDVYIGDIKAGVCDEWRVIPREARVVGKKIVGYDADSAREKVASLLASRIISKPEADEASALLKTSPTIAEFLEAKANIKFHIIRWTAGEVLANSHRLRDGSNVTLEDCFQTPGITKLDVIGLVQKTRFTDFSVIYEFKHRGRVINPEPINIKQSLEENILAYLSEGNYYKVLKRVFALAKYENDTKTAEMLTPILNSDLGRLYHVVSDIGTLVTILGEYPKAPMDIIRAEISQFRARLGNIYTLRGFLRDENSVIRDIGHVLRQPASKAASGLQHLAARLDALLQRYSKPIVEAIRRG
jgi:hypothetical protein